MSLSPLSSTTSSACSPAFFKKNYCPLEISCPLARYSQLSGCALSANNCFFRAQISDLLNTRINELRSCCNVN